MPLASVEEAIQDIGLGKFLIVVDDENRENEGDLVMAAEKVTTESINFMIQNARGLLCMPVLGKRLDALRLPLMVNGDSTARHGTAFSVSVDYNIGTTTGISAHDRSVTVKAILDPKSKPEDFARPGHLFPLQYEEGGVLVRPGHTEAIIDLARLAGLYPAGVVCEMISPDGTMARLQELEEFSKKNDVKIVSIGQLIAYRRRHEKLIEQVAGAHLPTVHGDFQIIAFKSKIEAGEHLALVMGEWEPDESVLVRIHSECLTGDVFSSVRCDCGEQIKRSLEMISQEGKGVFLYMRQEGRGIGLHNKIRAYALQDNGLDTVDANEKLGFESDLREYGLGAQVLSELGVKKMRLLTNNPRKVVGLSGYDLEIEERVPIEMQANQENSAYMRTKRDRMGHILWHC